MGEEGLIFKLIQNGNDVEMDVEIDVGAMSQKFTFELPKNPNNSVLNYNAETGEYVQKKKLLKNETGVFDLVDFE